VDLIATIDDHTDGIIVIISFEDLAPSLVSSSPPFITPTVSSASYLSFAQSLMSLSPPFLGVVITIVNDDGVGPR
jgi:hypothetical protein